MRKKNNTNKHTPRVSKNGFSMWQVSADVKGPTSRKRDCTVATYSDVINGQVVKVKIVAPRQHKAKPWTRKGY